MNQIRPGSGATAAVLAGSLAVFPLLSVLGLLARTRHTGELQVVADGVEARLWIDGGDLLDHSSKAPDRLFELACLDDAWFTVSSGLPTSRSEQADRIALEPLLEQVAPHVAEWQSLMKALPFGAVARMSPAMPGPEAQIRSDQWRILSLIGTGRAVHEVVDVSDGRPLETLRLIHELAQKELIVVELPSAAGRRRSRPAGATDDPADASGAADASGPADASHSSGAAGGTGASGAVGGTGAARGVGDAEVDRSASQADEVEPVGAARATTTPLTARRPGVVRATVPERPAQTATPGDSGASTAAGATPSAAAARAETASEPGPLPVAGEPTPESRRGESVRRTSQRSAGPPRRPGHHAVAAYMPPPVSPSFWPVLDPGPVAAGDHVDAVAAAAVVADAALASSAPDGPPPSAQPEQSA